VFTGHEKPGKSRFLKVGHGKSGSRIFISKKIEKKIKTVLILTACELFFAFRANYFKSWEKILDGYGNVTDFNSHDLFNFQIRNVGTFNLKMLKSWKIETFSIGK
jgi:hypothetical protein